MPTQNDNMILRLEDGELLRIPCGATDVTSHAGGIDFTVPFAAYRACGECFLKDEHTKPVTHILSLKAYGESILRLTFDPAGTVETDTPMLNPPTMPAVSPLRAVRTASGFDVTDSEGRLRARLNSAPIPTKPWSDLLPARETMLDLTLFPDGKTAVPLKTYDMFAHGRTESLPVGYIESNGTARNVVFAIAAEPTECFVGTGERFAKMDLAGRTLTLQNTDGMGVNSKRTYKNVPFYLSSKGYGLFIHTSSRIELSLADLSTRAAQARIDEPAFDLFLIGGSGVKDILRNYCCLTGFAPELPLWSYGTWMARMSYYSAQETREVARRMRDGGFPCDVLHIDTGWFPKDWVCDWTFSKERFPDPAQYINDMKQDGFRVSLWQTPDISDLSSVANTAQANGYLPAVPEKTSAGSDFSQQHVLGQIDFTNPAAVNWYKNDLLKPLLDIGVAVIKTDFGETIAMDGTYHSLPASKLRNRYALLYQQAAFEVSRDGQGTGQSLIWARAGWAGCQRYPLHWGGDAASTWDGMAASLRGGLHLGLSGFTYWSHDVPGFHGVPDFMNTWPTPTLYMRWTQFGVFSSHLRYHGTNPREPYEYPEVADRVRSWLNLRYTLIPYIRDQAAKSATNGLPLLRALILANETDPQCWHIDDEYMFGESFLVAPVMNDSGVRDIYLPSGEWIDFWTGQALSGSQWLRGVSSPLHQMPLFVRKGAKIEIYPEKVCCTDRMDMTKVTTVTMDEAFNGFSTCQELWK